MSPHTDWQGEAFIGTGLAVFLGRSGDNRAHQHLAHQVCLARPGMTLQLEVDGTPVQSEALWVRAGVSHRLLGHHGLLLWLDPTHTLAHHLFGTAPAPYGLLAGEWLYRLRSIERHWGPSALSALQAEIDRTPDARMAVVLATLRTALARGEPGDRAALAQACALSPERLSHWFREQTGLPLRSYRKWLRLVVAVEQALGGRSLTEAAHAAGFSDQAHFARTLRNMMGVTASSALRGVRWR